MDYATLDDTTLVRLLVAKDSDALGTLYDRYGSLVFSLAFAIINERGTAEEITQDVFLKIWENAEMYDQAKASFKNWLNRIARNRAIDVLRQERHRPEHRTVDWEDVAKTHFVDHTSPAEVVELRQQQDRIRNALAQIPSEQQSALSLAYLQGYTHQEIAQHLNQPLGTIKTRIRMAMKKLRDILQNP